MGQEQEISVLNAKIKKAKSSLSKIEDKIDDVRTEAAEIEARADEAKKIHTSIKDLQTMKQEGEASAELLEAELTEDYKLLKAYQDNYRYTTELSKGEALGNLTLKDGSSYSSAVYSGASSIGIQVAHSGGVGNVPYDQLPPEVAAKFQTPPATQTSVDLPTLLAGRPSFTADDEDEEATETAAVDNSPAAQRKRRIAETAKKREDKEQKREEIDAQLDVVYEKLKVVKAAIAEQENAKYAIVREQKLNKLHKRTSKSDADMAQITGAFDEKISALNSQRTMLLDEIKDLRSQRPRL